MAYKTARAALNSPTFFVQAFLTIVINCIVNIGIPYATYSNWGARDHAEQFPAIGMWRWNFEVQSCIGLDIFLTHFLLGMMCTWAGSGGAQKDVRERKCPTLEPAALARRPWVYTPVNIRSMFWRGIAMGLYFCLLAGVPILFLTWLVVRGDMWPGYSYVWVKGIYAGVFLATAVYVLVFLSAIDRRNFPELEYNMLGTDVTGSGGGGGFSDVVLDGADKLGASQIPGYYGQSSPVSGQQLAPHSHAPMMGYGPNGRPVSLGSTV